MNIDSDALQARHKIAETAQAVLNGDLSYIVAARRLSALRGSANVPDFDPDFIPFVAINSETDALPIGDERQYWAPDALARLDPEIIQAEQWARQILEPHCRKLLARFPLTAQR